MCAICELEILGCEESYQHENPTLVKNLSEKFWLPTQLTSLRLSRCPLSQSVAGACTAVHCACYSVCLLLRREVGISDNQVRYFRMMGLRIRIWLSLMLQYSYSCHGADNLQLWGWSRTAYLLSSSPQDAACLRSDHSGCPSACCALALIRGCNSARSTSTFSCWSEPSFSR